MHAVMWMAVLSESLGVSCCLSQSACYAWVTAVGSELLLHCNHRFSDLFLTTSELRDRLREKHIVHDLVWAR